MHLPRRRSGARLGDGLSAVVWSTCGVVSEGGRAPGAGTRLSTASLAVRVIHHDPAVSSDGGLLAQRARRRCVACVEILVQASSSTNYELTPMDISSLELCCASGSELEFLGVVLCLGFRVGCRGG